MKIHMKVLSGNPLQSRDQESNLFGCDRKMKMAWLNASNMKTTREPPITE
jgi:hypothetical protein